MPIHDGVNNVSERALDEKMLWGFMGALTSEQTQAQV